MTLRSGTRLGAYEITATIGEGGMGQVYRATDTRLKREVAIKILPPAFAADAGRLGRFQREAEVLASLNHPNIASIFGIEASDGVPALVMELVEGEDLSTLIARGPVSLTHALAIAMQIADALEAAHDKGIIHRDLKPANVRITRAGTVKVLDFGLAKTVAAPSGTNSAVTTLETMQGTILGTAPYMSPEQVRGEPVDKRTDIWAFGCVLYELVTGRRAFLAQTTAETIARILEHEPDWEAVSATSPAVRRVLRRSLEKDPRRRLRDIADARMDLADAPSSAETMTRRARDAGRQRIWRKVAGTAVIVSALAIAGASWRNHPGAAGVVRLSLPAPGQFFATPPSAVMSPDGRAVALVASDSSGKSVLWVRRLEAQEAHILAGTERADLPFWSPNSRTLGFFADGKLKTVDAAGGPVQELTSAPVSPGATWNQTGVILFADTGDRLLAVPETGGAPTLVIPKPEGGGVLWPHFLPDGRHFLYFVQHVRPEVRGVYVGSLDKTPPKRILDTETEATYAPPGYVLFVRNETLMAQPFDSARMALTGGAAVVAQGAWMARGYGHGVMSAGSNGALAYVNAAVADTQLAWFDRGGRPLGVVGPAARYDSPPQLSPNGETIAVARGPYFNQDIWLLNPTRGGDSRFTFDPAGSRVPVWFPDGSRLMFQSPRGDGLARLYDKRANGEGGDERLSEVSNVNLQDLSPDRRLLVYTKIGAQGNFELWVLPLSGDRPPYPFLQTASNSGQAQVSPDGHWLAYTSNETGRDEVYVQSFPVAGSKHQISTDGGAQPRWRRAGHELFYLAPDHVLMAVPITASAPLQTGRPVPLFRTHLDFLGLQGPYFMPGYDVTPDGQRFILNAPPEQLGPPVTILLNWTSALKQ